MLTKAVQSLFMPGLKVAPKSTWLTEFEELGVLERSTVERRGGQLSCCVIRTGAAECQGVVILAHPLGRRAKFFFGEGFRAGHYLRCGFDVVTFDFNGFGESDRIDFYYWKDFLAVAEAFPDYRIRLAHGSSFGGFHMLPALQHAPFIARALVENSGHSLYGYWKTRFITRWGVRLLQLLRLPSIRDMNPIRAAQGIHDSPHLVVVANSDDDIAPPEGMRELAETAASSEFVELPGDHLGSPKSDPIGFAGALNRLIAPSSDAEGQ